MLQVCFDCYGSYTTDSVYQWDLNRRLAIRGLDYASAPAIHFSNKKSAEALVVQSTIEDGVIYCDVPNILLQEPYDIVGYVCESLDQEVTTYETIRIPVKPRVKPADYAYSDNVEILTYYSLMAEISSVKVSNEKGLNGMDASKASKAELSAVKAEVDTDIAKVEDEIASERARIDQLVASPEMGEGDFEKEVEDLRIDTKGTTHGSAGTAVREQILGLDAKIDDNVSTLSSEIKELDTACLMYTGESWVFGTIKSETGKNDNATNRLRLEKNIPLDFFEKVTILNGYKFKPFFYDKNMVFVGTRDWVYSKLEKDTIVSSYPTAKYLRIIIANNSSSVTIDLSMVEESGIKFYMYIGKMIDNVYTNNAEKLPVDQYRKDKDYGVIFVAHQGMANTMPPNTGISFIEAINFGCDGIETDVHFTSDNIPVLLHDETINAQARNADGTVITNDVAIASSTYADLLSYDFGIKYGYGGTKICTFYDYIDLCKVYGIIPYIELKSLMTISQINTLLSYVEKRGIKNVVWSSTHSQNVKNIVTLRDNLTVAYQQTAKRTADDYASGDYKWFYDGLSKHNCIVRVSKEYADMEYIDSLRELGFLITIGTIDNTSGDITVSKTVLHGCDYYLHNHVSKNVIFE